MADAILASGGIYAIRNTINGKVYVGSALSMRERWVTHRRNLRRGKHHSEKLQRAWVKYGEAAFALEVLEPVPFNESLITREQYWIDFYRSADDGYNVCAVAGSILGIRRSAETKEKIGKAHRGRINGPMSEENRQKIAAALIGKPKSLTARANMSAASKGRPKSAEHIAKLSAANIGKCHSEDAKKRISETQIGRVKSEQECRNISAAQKMRVFSPLSEEHKAKISAAGKGRKQSPEWVAKRTAARNATMRKKSGLQI